MTELKATIMDIVHHEIISLFDNANHLQRSTRGHIINRLCEILPGYFYSHIFCNKCYHSFRFVDSMRLIVVIDYRFHQNWDICMMKINEFSHRYKISCKVSCRDWDQYYQLASAFVSDIKILRKLIYSKSPFFSTMMLRTVYMFSETEDISEAHLNHWQRKSITFKLNVDLAQRLIKVVSKKNLFNLQLYVIDVPLCDEHTRRIANPNNIKSRLIDTANIYRASYKRIVGIILNVLARNYPCLVTGICNKIQSYTVELIHNDR